MLTVRERAIEVLSQWVSSSAESILVDLADEGLEVIDAEDAPEEVITFHDIEMCAYEQAVGHPITGADLPHEGTILGYNHPDNCPDCAANPEVGRAVHQAEKAMLAALDAMRPFFSDNIEDVALMKVFMSGYVTMHAALTRSPVE